MTFFNFSLSFGLIVVLHGILDSNLTGRWAEAGPRAAGNQAAQPDLVRPSQLGWAGLRCGEARSFGPASSSFPA
jgi:hypothetical protein